MYVNYYRKALGKVNRNHITKMWKVALGNMNKLVAPIGQHGNYLFWLVQLLNRFPIFMLFSLMASEKRALYALTRGIGAIVPL